jgi:hypothetical protein
VHRLAVAQSKAQSESATAVSPLMKRHFVFADRDALHKDQAVWYFRELHFRQTRE